MLAKACITVIAIGAGLYACPVRPAHAIAYNLAATVDLGATAVEDVTISGNSGKRIQFDADFAPIEVFLVDTIHLVVTFANGDRLRLLDTGAPFLGDAERIRSFNRVIGFAQFPAQDTDFTFVDVAGSLLVNPFNTPNFEDDLDLTGSAFSFTGLVFDRSYSEPVFNPNIHIFSDLIGIAFEFLADDVSVIPGAAGRVPQPATFALLATGLLGLGGMIWRRYRGD